MGNLFVLYHSNCRDGFAAAWAAWKRFGEGAKYIACAYGKEPPQMPDGSSVYIVDFSFSREVLLELAQRMNKVVVLDHHRTAMKDLEGLEADKLEIKFDMDKSGARLSWEYFQEGQEVPRLIKHVEDRDLWRFQYEDTKAFGAFLNTLPFNMQKWDDLATDIQRDDLFSEVVERGEAVLAMIQKDADRMCWGRQVRELGDGKKVVLVNATSSFSEVCERALELEPDADFACAFGFNMKFNNVLFSLRSRQTEDCDVGEIAKSFGGGGHKHSAGFKIRNTADSLLSTFGGITL